MDGFDQNGLPITGAGVDYSTVGELFVCLSNISSFFIYLLVLF